MSSLFYQGLPLLAFAAQSLLAFLVLRVPRKHRVHYSFLFFLGLMALWGLFIFGLRLSPDASVALVWERMVLPLFPLIATSFLYFVLVLGGLSSGPWFRPVVAGGLFLSALAPTPLVVKEVVLRPYGWAPLPGPLMPPWVLATFSLYLVALVLMVRIYRQSTTADVRNRSLYILLGLVLGLAGGISDYLAAVGLFPYPLGIVGNILFAVFATIAIVRHRLLEIQIFVRRSAAYTLLSSVVILAYLGVLFLTSRVVQWQWQVLNIVFLLVVALAIHPLVRKFQDLVDRWVFRERYEGLQALRLFARQVSGIIDLDRLTTSLLDLTRRAMGTKVAHLMLYSEESGSLSLYKSSTLDPSGFPVLRAGNPLLHFLKGEGEVLQRADLEVDPRFRSLPSATRQAIEGLQGELFIPLRAEGKPVGLLVLGPKSSRDPYMSEDITLLLGVAAQAALSLENARLYAIEKRQVEELARLDEAKTDFLLTVAHHLKTPLTSLRLAVDLLHEMTRERGTREEQQVVEAAIRSVGSLEHAITSLLDFLKVKTQALRLNREPINLAHLIEESMTEVKTIALVKRQTLRSEVEEGLPLVSVDQEAIKKVLVSLLHNACKYTPEEGRIIVEARRTDQVVTVQVRDTGPGIPPEERKRVFDAYYQVKDLVRRDPVTGMAGTGLGLAIAKSLVEMHGGHIWVQDDPAGGACFSFTLPLADGEVREPPPAEAKGALTNDRPVSPAPRPVEGASPPPGEEGPVPAL